MVARPRAMRTGLRARLPFARRSLRASRPLTTSSSTQVALRSTWQRTPTPRRTARFSAWMLAPPRLAVNAVPGDPPGPPPEPPSPPPPEPPSPPPPGVGGVVAGSTASAEVAVAVAPSLSVTRTLTVIRMRLGKLRTMVALAPEFVSRLPLPSRSHSNFASVPSVSSEPAAERVTGVPVSAVDGEMLSTATGAALTMVDREGRDRRRPVLVGDGHARGELAEPGVAVDDRSGRGRRLVDRAVPVEVPRVADDRATEVRVERAGRIEGHGHAGTRRLRAWPPSTATGA